MALKDDLADDIRLLMRFIADLSLRIETCRALLRAQGVTDEEFAVAEAELKRRWDSQADALVEQIGEKRDAERVRSLLESPEDTETKH